jgi:prepilin signal peptidase PulO-like enzyme (type II secretory pathway)
MTFATAACLLSVALAATSTARFAERRLTGTAGRFAWEAIATAIALAAAAACEASSLPFLLGASVCIVLVAAGSVDARTGYLADSLTAPAAVLALARATIAGSSREALAAVGFYAGTLTLVFLFSKGNLIGFGDIKALYAIAASFGMAGTAFALLLASVSGLIVLRLSGRLRSRTVLNFGPHLAFGATLTLLTAGS